MAWENAGQRRAELLLVTWGPLDIAVVAGLVAELEVHGGWSRNLSRRWHPIAAEPTAQRSAQGAARPVQQHALVRVRDIQNAGDLFRAEFLLTTTPRT